MIVDARGKAWSWIVQSAYITRFIILDHVISKWSSDLVQFSMCVGYKIAFRDLLAKQMPGRFHASENKLSTRIVSK